MQSTATQSKPQTAARGWAYPVVFCLCLLSAAVFMVSVFPGIPLASRALSGTALFVCIAIAARTHSRIRAAVRRPTGSRCALVGTECGAIALGILLWAIWLNPPEPKFDANRCESIVVMIESGKLAEGPPGVVQLPPELASASWDGFVYVARLPKGRLYLFKTVALPLRPFNIRGYIYSTAPLDTLSNATDSEGHPWVEGKFVDWQSARIGFLR